MAERLGNVLYWAGLVLAAVIATVLWTASSGSSWLDRALLGLIAAIPVALGWAARYVLSGR
jgi:hypothetical protein